ncbi:fatty acid desaturase [Streptomyces sp. NPDC048278]|uniref:fatty acid desaturase family protein n=1 Tax=Streptomyces sp. NPDC048278 TaxID=3155809 RepID=UPI0034242DB3
MLENTEQFLDTPELLAKYKPLRRDTDGRIFAAKLALAAVLLAGGIFLTLTTALWARALGTVVVGLMFAHMLELQHETLHSIAFRGRRPNVVAGVLLGLPTLVSFAAYQVSHLRHHRDLGTPENQEFFDYGDQYGSEQGSVLRKAGLWTYRLTMVAHYKQFLRTSGRVLTGRNLGEESPLTQRRIRRDHWVILGTLVLSVAASALTHSWAVVWAWLLPLALVGLPAHALIELPEHFRCDTDTPDVFENTRTITSNRFMAWLTNTNNFHVEHHLLPTLPFRKLAEVHQEVAPRARFYHRTYRDFFGRLIRGERRAAR